jgi:hypothetical protein
MGAWTMVRLPQRKWRVFSLITIRRCEGRTSGKSEEGFFDCASRPEIGKADLRERSIGPLRSE